MPTADQDARVRLGELLAARRVEIDPRYADRMLFAVERMGSRTKWRTLFDVEHAKRDRFKPETLRAFEGAYRLAPNSLDRFDGDLEPLPADAPRLALVADPAPPGAELAALDRIAALLPNATRAELEMWDAVVGEIAEPVEVLRLLWSYPDPRGPVGKRLDLKTRLTMMRQYLAADPRGVLDDEDRNHRTGA